MTDPVIRLEGVRKSFGRASRKATTAKGATPVVRAVDGVDLAVTGGRVLALLGPSGCGKTTLLRLIAGFERPDAGSVTIAGAEVAGARTWVPPERRRVGMVFQDYALFPHLTVGGNVAFGLPRRRARARGALPGRVTEVLELVGLGGLADRYPHELSGGQRQRVALARALAPEPAVVLLDEPFSNLDAGLRAQVRADIHRILSVAGATALFVTHDQEEALSVADEVAVMHAGRIVQQATPEDLYRSPADRTVAAFVGDAELLPGHSVGLSAETDLGMVALTGPVQGAVEVVVRPESLVLTKDQTGDAVVVAREFYGHDQVLHLRLASGRLVRARLGPVTDLLPGDRCRVTVPGCHPAFPA
ncbi:MAG TPA: ABC transporter ATP-binding protein [Egibacteraceae bacterium]|nr:ABC transporter ATP-binding protein [Egibacteraceae bacterium]